MPSEGFMCVFKKSIAIKQDSKGRYCLNDCHRASGMSDSKRPSNWLRNEQAIQLITEISQSSNSSFDVKLPFSKNYLEPVNVIKGGNNSGTYVVKELVYAYAMWISPSFNLKVINEGEEGVTISYTPGGLQQKLILKAVTLMHC